MSVGEVQHTRAAQPGVRGIESTDGVGTPLAAMQSDLPAWLLGRANAETFWEEHWERELLLVARDDPSYFSSFLGMADLDRLISSLEFPASRFDLAKDSVPVPKQSYARGPVIDIDRALALHRDGATIILRAAHAWCAPLRLLRGEAEAQFRSPAQVNVYLTPPENQSTPPHWDTHDLFVLQLEGAKVWRIFESPRELPLDEERFTSELYEVGPLVREFTMRAGDVLYMPRGTIHEPRSETYSVHVALGLPFLRWADLLAAVVRAASENSVELRKSFRVPSNPEELGELASGLGERLAPLHDPETLSRATQEVVKAFVETREPDVSGQLTAVARPVNIGPGSIVRRRRGACLWTETDGSRAYLRWRTRSAAMPLELEPFVGALAGGAAFRVRDLPGTLPEEAKIAAVEALVADGLLEYETV